MPRPSSRQLLAALVVAGAVGGGLLWHSSQGSRGSDSSAYTTALIARGDLTARVTATGTLSALVTVQVGSQVSGRISEINVDFNSPVKKGQVIARIDPQMFRAAVEQAAANLSSAEANAAKARVQEADAERQAQRAQELFNQKLVAVSDRDTARANADSAHAALAAATAEAQQSRASLHQAQINLAYTTIAAPTDGVVISRSVDVGQTVAATLAAPTLFTIAQDLRQMQVDTNVAEADVGRLSEGMATTFSVDAYPSERFSGRVRQIRNAPLSVQNVVTYDAVIDVDNTDLRLKPGMTANVNFIYAERKGVLRVPNAALRFRPPADFVRTDSGKEGGGKAEGGRPHRASGEREIWVLRDGKPAPVRVQVGVSDGSNTEVTADELHEGDTVIVDAAGGDKKRTQAPAGRVF